MAKRKSKASGEICTSAAQLARAVGVSEKSISLWRRDLRWPREWAAGPWNPDAVRRWRAANLQSDPGEQRGANADTLGPGGAITSDNVTKATSYAKLQLLVERAAKIKVDRLIAEKQYVKREESEQSYLKKQESIRVTLMQVGRAMRNTLAHKTPDEVETILNDALQKICDDGFGGGHTPPGDHDGHPDDR